MPIDLRARGGWHRRAPLAAAVLLALSLQAILAARSSIIAKDGIGFILIAQQLAADPRGEFQRQDQHPGYPAMILAGARIARYLPAETPDHVWVAGARLAGALAGTSSIIFLWLFARRLYDERIADLAALLAAVWPLLRWNASDVLSDTPQLACYLAAAWLACEGLVRRRSAWFAAAGAASGLAYWIRPEGLLVSLVTAAVILTELLRRERPPATKSFSSLAALAAATLLIVAPYAVLSGKLTSKKNPFAKPNAQQVAVMQAPEPESGLLAEPRPGARLPDELPRLSSSIGRLVAALYEFGKELAQGMYYLCLIPLLAGTFARGRLPRQPLTERLVIALWSAHALLLVALHCLAGYISHRHMIPLIAMSLPATAAGVVYLANQAAARAPAWAPKRWATAALTAAMVLGFLPKAVQPLHEVYRPLIEASKWVKAHCGPDDSVLATSRYVRYYSGLSCLLLGPEAPNLGMGLEMAPHARSWPFLVLEVDERTFDRRSLCGPGGDYDQVLELTAHPRKTWCKVLVFRAKCHADNELATQAELTARN